MNSSGLMESKLIEGLGSRIRNHSQDKIAIAHQTGNTDSIWFPYGWGGFGGHYTTKQLSQILEEMPDKEIGAKGLKLRGIVTAIVLAISTAAYNSPLGDTVKSHLTQQPEKTLTHNPSK